MDCDMEFIWNGKGMVVKMQKFKITGRLVLLAVCLLFVSLFSCARQEIEQNDESVGSFSTASLPTAAHRGAALSQSAAEQSADTAAVDTAYTSVLPSAAQEETRRQPSAAAAAKPETAATGVANSTVAPIHSISFATTHGITHTEPPAAPSKPQAAETAADSRFLTDFEAQVVALVNRQRVQNGLLQLAVTAPLRDTAHLRAEELIQSFSHTRPDGTRFFTAFPPSNTYGENAARDQQTPGAVMESWLGSKAHRQNILDPSFTRIGVGCIRQGDTLYWVQCFIGD